MTRLIERKAASFLFTLMRCSLLLLSLAADFSGKVLGITDSDTIRIMYLGKAEKISLNGID